MIVSLLTHRDIPHYARTTTRNSTLFCSPQKHLLRHGSFNCTTHGALIRLPLIVEHRIYYKNISSYKAHRACGTMLRVAQDIIFVFPD